MTQQKAITVNCPACFEDSTFKIYSSVDISENPELKKSIFDRSIFKFSCPLCGEEILVSYDCTYTDSENKYIIALVSEANETNTSILSVEGFALRIVHSINEFVEKIALLEDGIDDKVIELYKIMLEDQFEDERPGSKILGIYYSGRDFEANNLSFFIITENSPNCHAVLSMQVYEAIETQFRDSAEKFADHSEINRLWAIGVLQSGFDFTDK